MSGADAQANTTPTHEVLSPNLTVLALACTVAFLAYWRAHFKVVLDHELSLPRGIGVFLAN